METSSQIVSEIEQSIREIKLEIDLLEVDIKKNHEIESKLKEEVAARQKEVEDCKQQLRVSDMKLEHLTEIFGKDREIFALTLQTMKAPDAKRRSWKDVSVIV